MGRRFVARGQIQQFEGFNAHVKDGAMRIAHEGATANSVPVFPLGSVGRSFAFGHEISFVVISPPDQWRVSELVTE
jgi:hypothetical protein